MRYRKLGRTGLEVSEIGVGAWAIGGDAWGPTNDDLSRRALLRAFELGANFVDTALSYGHGHSERLVGRAVRDFGGDVAVATKIPPRRGRWPPRAGTRARVAFPADWIARATESSLRNLGVERLDLQQLHTWLDEWLDESDWQEAVSRLKTQGKIRAFGISLIDHRPETALRAVASEVVDSVQLIFNIFDQTARDILFDPCRLHDVGIIVRAPFDEGSLTGRLTPNTRFPARDFRREYFRGERLHAVCRHVEKLRGEVGEEEGSLAQFALRFCLSHEAVSSVIPGMRTPAQAEENCMIPPERLSAERLDALRAHAWARNYYRLPLSRRLWTGLTSRLRVSS
jgi:aryl-alcohol dehydrogenase-like predicted oxidoreductase